MFEGFVCAGVLLNIALSYEILLKMNSVLNKELNNESKTNN